jgi:dihydropyrimidine dehydrogenase (NAD+) subunit PreA
MAVGAGVVQFCTAVMHRGLGIIDDLQSGMGLYLEEMQMASPLSIVGKALPQLVPHDDLPRLRVRSRIDEASCIGCEVCYLACRDGGHMAMDRRENRIPKVDEDRCVGCGLCAHVCPEQCITLVGQ